MANVRTHIMVSDDLIEAVDALVGARGRSRFFTAAIRRELARRRLVAAAKEAAGAYAEDEIPGWSDPDESSAWVRSLRAADDSRLQRSGGEDGK